MTDHYRPCRLDEQPTMVMKIFKLLTRFRLHFSVRDISGVSFVAFYDNKLRSTKPPSKINKQAPQISNGKILPKIIPIPHGLPCAMEFSREFNLADCRFCAFRGNKFSQIWISDFTAKSKFSRISGKYLSGISRAVLVIFNSVNLI